MTSLIEVVQKALANLMPAWRGLGAIRPVPEKMRETPVIQLPIRRSKLDYFDAA